MTLRLRQVVVAARDLAATRTQIEDSLGLPHVWADPGVLHFGLHNALYAIGDCFLEVVSPFRDDAPATRFLDRAGHDAGYMAIVQTTEPVDDVRRRADELAVRVVFTAEGNGVTGLHMHPSDTGATLLSVDRCDDPAAWPWAGPAWECAPNRRYRGIKRAAFAVSDPTGVAARWASLLGATANGTSIALDGAILEFVAGGGGLCEVDLAGPAHEPVTIANVEFRVN